MRKSLRRNKARYFIAFVLNVLLILMILFISISLINKKKSTYDLDIKNIQEQMQSQKILVYQAKENIPIGELVTKDKLNLIEAYSSQGDGYYISEEQIGMLSRIEIKKGTFILGDMLAKDEKASNLREIEYNAFLPNTNLKTSDHIDLRILFPNGEDYIILSKKNIKNLDKETGNCFLWLNEKEILDMAGAVVDTYIFPGSKIYTSKYLEPELQEASTTNYRPNLSTLALMKDNVNILNKPNEFDEILLNINNYDRNQEFREKLEQRLEEFYEKTELNFNDPIEGIGAQEVKAYQGD